MLQIIINPTAGNGRAAKVGEEIAAEVGRRGVAYATLWTEHPGHATELAKQAAAEGAQTVVAIGGDGTILEVVRGLYGTGAALGIIPAGTGNDVVKMLSIPRKPMEALDFLLQTQPRALDAGRINEKVFLNVSGTGFDVAVLRYAQIAKRYVKGLLPYLWGVLRAICSYQPTHVTLSMEDDTAVTRDILVLAVANGQFIGGGMAIAPDAKPDDGLFDVVVIDAMPRWQMPFQLVKLLTGKIRSIPGTSYQRCRRVAVQGTDMYMNIDGEIVPLEKAEMEILPGALCAHW